jgi:catechol 2,3-dioxygenase-like lactoylglutathione lyase family enzyme
MKFVFSFTGVRVRDLDQSIRFYTEVLGMRFLGRTEIPWTKGETAGLQSGHSGHILALNWYSEKSPAAGPFKKGDELDYLTFEVKNLDKALEHLRKKGHQPISEKEVDEDASWTYIEDPDGNWIQLFEIPR